MKNIKFSFILIAAIISFTPVAETKAQHVSVSFSTFQQTLNPYGRWMNNPRFGQVWINNDANFRPYYTNGHWEYTNYGWSWISDYDWGWAPFHYGRWEHDPFYGWMWIPGYEWGAAWVSWSSYGNYYGWAPLGYGSGINSSFGAIPYNYWTFIPRRNICDRDIYRHYVPHVQNNQFRNAVVINNYYNGRGNIGRFVRGPERKEVERYTGNRVTERKIDYTDRNRNRNNITATNANQVNRNNNSRTDVNTGGNTDAANQQSVDNRQKQNNRDSRPVTVQTDDNTDVNNAQKRNKWRNRETTADDKNTTTTPPVFDNINPNPEVKPLPQQNENRMRRNNDRQNNFPQQQPNVEPVPQQQNTRPIQQQQRQPAMQPQQQRQPDMQQQQQNTRPIQQQQRQQPAMQPQQQRKPAMQPQQQNTRPMQQEQRQPAMQQRSIVNKIDAMP